jgi:hypothetical protein
MASWGCRENFVKEVKVFTPSLVRIGLANSFNLTKKKLNKSIYSGNSPLVCMPNI